MVWAVHSIIISSTRWRIPARGLETGACMRPPVGSSTVPEGRRCDPDVFSGREFHGAIGRRCDPGEFLVRSRAMPGDGMHG